MTAANNNQINVLYVCWDGPQVSYLEGLFLPIFLGLREKGYAFHVLQFTWDEPRDEKDQETHGSFAAQIACEELGIPYERVIISRLLGGIGPYLSARNGGVRIDYLVGKWFIDVLMPRSIMGAIAVTHSKAATTLPIVFDADGLAADERADFGSLSRASLTYKVLKAYERSMISRSQAVIGRTAAACQIYRTYDRYPKTDKYYVSVNGRDPEQFCLASEQDRFAARNRLNLPTGAPIVVHSGSFGEKYCPSVELALVLEIRKQRPETRFLILTGETQSAVAFLESQLGEVPDWVSIRRLPFTEMGAAISACDVGLCLYGTALSTQAFQATKLGEFLLSGLSVIATPNAFVEGLKGRPFAFCWQPSVGANETVARWFCDSVSIDAGLRMDARAFALEHLTVDASVCAYHGALTRASQS